MSFYFYTLIPLIFTPIMLILAKRDIVFFVFFAVLYIQYYFSPVLLMNQEGYAASYEYFEAAFYFWVSLTFGYFILGYFVANYKIIYIERKLDLYFILYFALGAGLIFKILTSSFLHVSISGSYNFEYWYLFGFADKIYYLGLSALIAIMCFHPNKFITYFFIFFIIMLVFTGSRSLVILPIIMLFSLKFRHLSLIKSMWIYLILILIIAFIIIAVGLYRVDEVGRDIPVSDYLYLFLFRFSDFVWSNLLIETFTGPFGWKIFINDLYAIFPSGVSKSMLGYSIFEFDTLKMEELGIGTRTRSVPMGMIGESYMALGIYGVIFSGIVTSFIFLFIKFILKKLSPLYKTLVLLQMCRYSLVLSSGTLADIISMGSKDLLFSIIIVGIFILIRKLFCINSK